MSKMFTFDFQLCVDVHSYPTMAALPQDIYFGQNSIITQCHNCQRYDTYEPKRLVQNVQFSDLKLNFSFYREVQTVVEGRSGAGAWISAALLCLIGFEQRPSCHCCFHHFQKPV